MKKFLVVLLALGLVVAFSAPAAATDVKFSGSYTVWGYYEDNQSLQESDADSSTSSDFYAQRLRIKTVFQVAEGLSLTTRFDAMERVWGGNRDGYEAEAGKSATEERNIRWERAYVTFAVPYGTFYVGYQSGGTWGTVFADQVRSTPRIKFVNKTGPWTFLALTEKQSEGDIGTEERDKDYDHYAVAFIYKWDQGNAGVLWYYLVNKDYEPYAPGPPVVGRENSTLRHLVMPYFKATVGPVYLEGEINYIFGTTEYDDGSKDMDHDGWSGYIMAKVPLDQFYVGGQFAYVEGDDPDSRDNEAGHTGQDYNPCLILFGNDKLYKWTGDMGHYGATNDTMENAFLYQIFAGMKPIEKLDVRASLTYAEADETPEIAGVQYVDDDYGTEFDITATYKIYDNLSYMVGFGYLWTGDYYKGDDSGNKIDDNYLVMNRLTLKF